MFPIFKIIWFWGNWVYQIGPVHIDKQYIRMYRCYSFESSSTILLTFRIGAIITK